MTMNEIELKISGVCDDIKELLIHKNRKYGNSALKPNRIFSKCSATEQLLVRIDDKLNRIMKGAGLLATDEDVVNDLIGYLVLLKISMESDKHNEILEIATSIYGKGFRSEETSSTMPETSINYQEFEKNYSRELLLMDCLDWLKDRPLRREGDPRPLGVLFQ
ncbi:MAG: hypothetical protein CM15mV31_0360 [uncultured marine virus]|nr:MAG: hypothetical protein CM15mV31_0360 [uncultured marine virus]